MAARADGHQALAKAPWSWTLAAANLPILMVVGMFYLLLSYIPLGGPRLWATLNYGDWILRHRSLPTEDPLLPLAEGMRVVDTEWLSQVVLSGVNSAGGAWWLSQFFAMTGALTLAILARAFYLNNGSRILSAVGGLAVILLGWSAWSMQGPATMGLLSFAVLLWLIADRVPDRPELPRRLWIGVPTLFVVWTNLHGSFIYGLVVLLCCLIGRLAEVGWRTKSIAAVAADPVTRQWLYVVELACAATLLNPQGLDVFVHALWAGPQEQFWTPPSWQPLTGQGLVGWSLAGSIVLLVVVLGFSRRPLSVSHGLLIALFAGAAAGWSGMITWYAPVFVLVALPHLVWSSGSTAGPTQGTVAKIRHALNRPSWHASLVAAVFLWLIFILSPIGSTLLHREARSRDPLLPADTPVTLTAFLNANPPAGQIFNPWWWGDWLTLEGPAQLKPFAASRLELLPASVWRDYRRVEAAEDGWSLVLERYGIRTVVVDKKQQPLQWEAMRSSLDWRALHEDDLAAVFAATAPRAWRDSSE